MASIPLHFYLNKKLYKRIKEVRSEDYVTVFDFAEERLGRLSLSYTKRNMSNAYTIEEVAGLLKIARFKIKSMVDRGLVSYPTARAYNIKTKSPLKWYWSADDVMDLRQVMYDLAPKDKNGDLYANSKLVGLAELKSAILKDTTYYIKGEDGELVRVWRAID